MAFGENPTVVENTEQQNLTSEKKEKININDLGTPKNLSNKILENGTIAKNQEAIEKIEDLYETLKLALENSEYKTEQKEEILNTFKNITNPIKSNLQTNKEFIFNIGSLSSNELVNIFNEAGINLKNELNQIIKESVYIKPKFENVQNIKGDKNIELSDTFETILGEDYITELENKLPDFIDKIQIKYAGSKQNDKYFNLEVIDSTGNIKSEKIAISSNIIKEIRESNKKGITLKTNISKIKETIKNNINNLINKFDGEDEINKNNNFEDINLNTLNIDNFNIDNPLNKLLLKKLYYHTDININEIKLIKKWNTQIGNNSIPQLKIVMKDGTHRHFNTEIQNPERQYNKNYLMTKLIEEI